MCLDEEICAARAKTSLGSSIGYNLSGAWAPPGGNPAGGGPPAYTCQGLDSNCTRVFLPYCDGSCFTSSRNTSWPVPRTLATPSSPDLHFKGLGNLERILDVLTERVGLAQARRVRVTGGSAGVYLLTFILLALQTVCAN